MINCKTLIRRALLIALASFCGISAAAHAQSAGSSDRVEGSFDIPGWFSKDQSDIARYPVPLLQPSQNKSNDSAPLVVLQKWGPPNAPTAFTSKSIWTPTPFGYRPKTDFSALASNPWAAPGATPFGFGGFGGYYGGISSMPGGFSGLASYHSPSAWSGGGYRYGFGAPYMHSSGFSMGGFGFGYNRVSTTVVVPPPETKASGNNYYSGANSGNSGNNYYGSNSPWVQPQAVTIPPKQSPKDYWGDSGSPFGKDLNKTPW